ncbi:gamma-glutamylcyclotransferase family protein [Streptomyces cavernicola]|uniref:Gamma-glutamylcyclotransferase n=1 Tax=Streptomyces cavernicola TaxID=3043613 RepID=A0ABT6SF41_9ACTN|nr:gamma-glutamylcyclotransferase family protein [Streptomyces sp. B-S-A6]MDI3406297.1 gamma-glutamylcyclotransferase [Streptomyces sp. B-S-A6]
MTDPSTPSGPLPFFVYGTLRPGEYNHDRHLRGRVEAETPALLPDAALHEGPGYPYLVEQPGAGPVHGELLTARPESYAAVLADLDRLEDYRPGDPHNDYERIARDVHLPDGTTRRAWVYVAAPAVRARLQARAARLIPGGDWRADDRRAGEGWPGEGR